MTSNSWHRQGYIWLRENQHSHSPNSHFPPRSGAHFKLKLPPFDWLVSDLRYQVVLPRKSGRSSDLEYVSFWLISVWANKKFEKKKIGKTGESWNIAVTSAHSALSPVHPVGRNLGLQPVDRGTNSGLSGGEGVASTDEPLALYPPSISRISELFPRCTKSSLTITLTHTGRIHY